MKKLSAGIAFSLLLGSTTLVYAANSPTISITNCSIAAGAQSSTCDITLTSALVNNGTPNSQKFKLNFKPRQEHAQALFSLSCNLPNAQPQATSIIFSNPGCPYKLSDGTHILSSGTMPIKVSIAPSNKAMGDGGGGSSWDLPDWMPDPIEF